MQQLAATFQVLGKPKVQSDLEDSLFMPLIYPSLRVLKSVQPLSLSLSRSNISS